jgi:myo-inositol-1(or 4)-monophosphatase
MTAATLERTDLELIVEAAHEAGELAGLLRRRGLEIEYKAGDSTPVTNADLAADALLTERLRTARPDYGWLSEETVDDPDRLARRRLFVVDPIDGTRAFLNDKPWWSVSIAVVDGSRPVAGVVFAPQLEETYAAAAGSGATLNGRPIRASAAVNLKDSGMVADPRLFTLPHWRQPWPQMRVAQRNSTAYRMCLVASGAFDAAVTLMPKHDWDLAAADLIAGEAGCFVGNHTGAAFVYNGTRPVQANLICAAPGLAPLILDRVSHIAAPT